MLETIWESRWLLDFYGGVAQLGEHLPCKQGVKSSNLSISIRFSYEKLMEGISDFLRDCQKWQIGTLKTEYIQIFLDNQEKTSEAVNREIDGNN